MNSSPHIRYNKDGSTRPETRLEQLERENLNANGGGGGSARRQQQRLRDNATPWLPAIDQAFFSFPSLKAGFRRFSDKYNDFKEFYKKLLQAANKASKGNTSCISTDDPVKLMEKALALFADFNDKKQRTLAAKILKDRSSLPIKTYQQQILDAVKLNPVVLVAADTGAGKSTQVPQYLLEAGYDKIGT